VTRIVDVRGRRVWDSRGRPTVEAEVEVGDAGGARRIGRAIAPAGASTGSGEALELRDGGRALHGLDVRRAVAAVNGEIRSTLVGLEIGDQEAIDAALVDLDGTHDRSRLGGNALVAVSLETLTCATALMSILAPLRFTSVTMSFTTTSSVRTSSLSQSTASTIGMMNFAPPERTR